MNDLNFACVIGHVTRDAELKYTKSGTAVCNFSIGVNRSIRPNEDGGEWKTEVSFFDCQAWGKLAESRCPKLLKGKQISVHGEMRQDRWEQDGKARSKVYIVVDMIQLLADPKNKDAQDQSTPAPQQPATSSRGPAPRTYTPPPASNMQSRTGTASPSKEPMFDDDIPF